MDKLIPIAGPSITQKEVEYVADAAANGWYTNAGRYVARFEAAVANLVGRKYALATPSCTSAIHLSLLALGIGPGDEVIVPEITWIGTAAPVNYVGARPVFVDIAPESWCIDPESVRRAITPRTKAIILVDLYGALPDMDVVLDLSRRHGISVIEDAAQAIGAEYKGRKAGSFGDLSTFSFHGTKALTTGEGGMLLTDSEDVFRRARYLASQAMQPGSFWNTEVAQKYKMSDLQAALGLAQIERVDELIARKRTIFRWYRDRLEASQEITLNPEPKDVSSIYWMVTAILDPKLGITKNSMGEAMKHHNIAIAGRYPKHRWPQHPESERPGR